MSLVVPGKKIERPANSFEYGGRTPPGRRAAGLSWGDFIGEGV